MNFVFRFLVVTLLGCSFTTRAAQVIELLPLRKDILLLRISDGSISYAKKGELQTADKVMASPLTTASLTAAAFAITSVDDTAYAISKAATALARKSKGVDFANNETNWISGYGYKPADPYAVSEHLLYLTLPSPLVEGKSYTVSWNKTTLGLESGTAHFSFSSASSRSEAIHVNIVGYVPTAAAKYGYLYHWAGDGGGVDFSAWAGKPFVLVRESDSSVVFTGTVTFRKSATNIETGQTNDTPNRNFIGAAVWECDFSSFTQTGRYRLSIPGVGCSFPFSMDADVYRSAFHATMKGLYQNRSGIALVTPFADKARPAPHNVKITPGFSGRLKYTTTRFTDCVTDGGGAADKAAIEAGAKGALSDTWGWYQDAGDWDGYFQHTAIPNSLLLLYQMHPEKFSDGELNIPESGNGIPDIVDEGAWLPRYFARLRAELKTRGWGTGGVGGRVLGDYWGPDRPSGFMRGSWQDVDRDWYVTGEDPFTSYRYAATAAQLAEIFLSLGKSDPQGVDWLAEATDSYAWATSHTVAGDSTKDINGTLKDHRAVAAAALFRVTKDEAYHTVFKSDVASVAADTTLNETQLLAVTLYLSHAQSGKLDATVRQRLTASLKQNALSTTESSGTQRACRWGGNFWYPMLVGQTTTPMIMPGILGYKILTDTEPTAAATVLSYAYTTSDYFLGTNPLNTTWVTGLGPRFPHAVFHMDDWLSGTTPHTGIVPYGATTFAGSWIPYRMNASLWWAWDTTYPTIDGRGSQQPEATAQRPGTWPGHECFFPQRGSPQATEFTIWQTILPSAVTYGFLCNTLSKSDAFATQPTAQTVSAGNTATFNAVGGRPGTYQWQRSPAGTTTWENIVDGGSYSGVTTGTLSVSATSSGMSGDQFRVVHTVDNGATTSASVTLTVLSSVAIATQPQSAITTAAGAVTLTVTAVGSNLTYQWQKEGKLLPGATDSFLAIPSASSLDAGNYSVTVKNGTDLVKSSFATVTVSPTLVSNPAGRLVNISSRTPVSGSGDKVQIAGFVIAGTVPKAVLIRASGPALTGYGVNDSLADPMMTLFDAAGSQISGNDNWDYDTVHPIATTVGAFAWKKGSKDAAIVATLSPGAYTAIVKDATSGDGVALVEVYEVGSMSVSRPINISTRSLINTGDAVQIAGFVVGGSGLKTILVRASGPSLGAFGVFGVIANPLITIYDAKNDVVAANDDWDYDTIQPVATRVGAFNWARGSKDAALVVTLPTGVYTAVVKGADGGTGVGLVEIYDVNK